MNELIKIQDFNGKKAVSAREVYEKLGMNKTQFARWSKKNITENPFAIEKEDWIGFDIMSSGNETQDFALSLTFAKKLSMMARTPEGEKVRDYFIEVEKIAKESHLPVLPKEPEELLLQSVQLMIEQKKRINAVEKRMDVIEAKTNTTPGHFAIMGYARLHGIEIGLHLAASLGAKAKRICKDKGLQLETIPDPRFGRVNTYPYSVLEQVFNEYHV